MFHNLKDWLRWSWCWLEGGHFYTALYVGGVWYLMCVSCGHTSNNWKQK